MYGKICGATVHGDVNYCTPRRPLILNTLLKSISLPLNNSDEFNKEFYKAIILYLKTYLTKNRNPVSEIKTAIGKAQL